MRFFEGNLDTGVLPAGAKAALDALRERVSDLRDLVEVSMKRKEEAREEHLHELWQLSMRKQAYGFSTEDYEKHRVKIDAAHKKLLSFNDSPISQRWTSQKRLLTRVEAYVASLRATCAQAPSPSVKFPSADRLLPEIDKQRTEIATLLADRHEILSKAFPSIEIKARARAEIEELARRGAPDVSYVLNHGPSEGLVWPDYRTIARGGGIGVVLPGDTGFTSRVDAPHLPLLAWLFKDRLLAAIEAEIDANSEDEQSLSLEVRTKKLSEIDARILMAERVDVAMTRHSGGAADYRDDTDPRAFLGVEGPPSNED
ncbi:hypothetical protein HB774_24080 [Rhizobium leguminosarum bv. viciae]|nr:hypothetical protein HB774_24080 [Rhizobium leguminosarum bv. viciae]